MSSAQFLKINLRIPLSPWLFSLAIITSGLSLFEAIDIYELPFEKLLTFGSSQAFSGTIGALMALGYPGLFLLMVLESMALPIPSEVFLPMAGYLVFVGKFSFVGVLAVSTIGGLVGSLLIFYASLLVGRPVVYSLAGRIGVSTSTLAKSEKWLSGRGSLAVLIARFVPGLRSAISIPAGALKMNVLKFSIVTLLGSFGWSLFLIYVGLSAGSLSRPGVFSGGSVGTILIYGAAAISLSYLSYYVYARLGRSKRFD